MSDDVHATFVSNRERALERRVVNLEAVVVRGVDCIAALEARVKDLETAQEREKA